ncbi:MAG: hypothetical protein ACM3KM_03030 [Acidobacteriaceae bacterium]
MSSNKQEGSPPSEAEVVIGEICRERKPPYVVAYTTSNGDFPKGTSITFALTYWAGKMDPIKGQVVVVSNIQKFAKGWRAFGARPVMAAATSKKQEAGGES